MSPPRWHESLAARHGLVLLGCVALGSLLLVAWLGQQQRAESEREFARLAGRHADFVQRLNLPRSAKLALDLRALLGLEIGFRTAAGAADAANTGDRTGAAPHVELTPAVADAALAAQLTALPADGALARLPGGWQALALRLDARHDMLFLRAEPPLRLSLRHPATLRALLAFWLLSALLIWMSARQVVRPVAALTRALPGFFQAGPAEQAALTLPPPPGLGRRDEVGQLAAALARARAELHEERQRREQSERLALLGRVATGLAHEIKNPLAAIQLHAQLMEGGAMDAEGAASLRHVRAEARVIEGLVNQWLYLARPTPPETARFDLRGLLEETLELLSAQAAHAGVEPRLAPGAPLWVKGDRERLRQAFRNVVVNALQAMPGGGLLRVALERAGTEARVLFHDDGPGFSPAALAGATGLFFSEKEGGMGVGLNVALEILSAHGGSLAVKNHPQGGALVEMRLPCEGGAD